MGAIKKHPSTALHQCLYLYHHPLMGFVQLHHEAATQAESWPHGRVTTHTTMPSPAHASCQRSASLKPSNFSSKESKTSPNPTSPCSLRISLSLSNTAAENEGYWYIWVHTLHELLFKEGHMYIWGIFFPHFHLLWLPSFYRSETEPQVGLEDLPLGNWRCKTRRKAHVDAGAPLHPQATVWLRAASPSWYELSNQNK